MSFPKLIRKERREILNSLIRFEKDSEYFERHKNDFREKYLNSYVAVYNCQVVDHDGDLDSLLQRLRKNYGQKTVDNMLVEYIWEKEPHFILPVIAAS